jgi:hypothetical protein
VPSDRRALSAERGSATSGLGGQTSARDALTAKAQDLGADPDNMWTLSEYRDGSVLAVGFCEFVPTRLATYDLLLCVSQFDSP